jgi:hypothetical protein
LWIEDACGKHDGSLSRPEQLLCLRSSSSIVLGPIPDPLLLGKSGSAGNRTQTSGSIARNSDYIPQRQSLDEHYVLIEEEEGTGKGRKQI